MLFYGNSAAGGVQADQFVEELSSRAQFDSFVRSQKKEVLTVVNVSLTSASPCVHVFPAVLALAKNFVGYASFARLLGDSNPELQQLMLDLNVVEVPTFIFYR